MNGVVFTVVTITNEDCRNVLKSIDDESIDLIVTDPPYKMTSRGGVGTTGGMLLNDVVNSGNVFENVIDVTEYASEFYRVLKDSSHLYVMCNNVNLIKFLNHFEEVGFHFIKSLIWDKMNKICGTFYMGQYEYILFFRKGAGKQINYCGTSDIIRILNKKTTGLDGKPLHITEKPIELMEILVRNSSNTGDTVLDPFVGIGSTAIACKHLDRNFIGCEIDKKYFDIATQRLSDISFVDLTAKCLF